MRIIEGTDYGDMCRRAASVISAQMILKPDSVLGLATGSTSEGIYAELASSCSSGLISFAKTKTVNLDEYVGLSESDVHSYHYFMKKKLFSITDICAENTHIPDGMCDDINDECRRYDDVIASLGGADIQLLGVGRNGHIGFNEPGVSFETRSHCVRLSQSTISANARFFGGDESAVPREALTMGIKNIMSARMILLAASGAAKAEALRLALTGPVTPGLPASVLQLHDNVIIVGDREALSLL